MTNPTRPIVMIEIGNATIRTIGPISPLTTPKISGQDDDARYSSPS